MVGGGVGGAAALDDGAVEVAGGDGKHANQVADSMGGDGAVEFEADDGLEEGLDAGAVIEGDRFGFELAAGLFGTFGGDGVAFGQGGAGGVEGVLALLFFIGGIVVDAEAGIAAGGEAAGLARARGGRAERYAGARGAGPRLGPGGWYGRSRGGRRTWCSCGVGEGYAMRFGRGWRWGYRWGCQWTCPGLADRLVRRQAPSLVR